MGCAVIVLGVMLIVGFNLSWWWLLLLIIAAMMSN